MKAVVVGSSRLAGTAHARGLEVTAVEQADVSSLARFVGENRFDTVLFARSDWSGPVASALAARLGAGIVWGVVDLRVEEGTLTVITVAFDGTATAEVGWLSDVRIAVCEVAAFDHADTTLEIPVTVVEAEPVRSVVEVLERSAPQTSGPSIEDAEIIVAAGGGVGSADGFAAATTLAQALGGAVASSSVPVMMGWAPPDALVGLSGRTIAPRLYVALGISGATQHTVGMRNARTVIAINSDPSAPMLARADLAVVAKIEDVVPRLTALIRDRRK